MSVKPKRIQLSRKKGWRKPEGCIVVARPTKWGNPFRVGDQHVPNRAEAVRMFACRFVGPFAQPMPVGSRLGWIAANIEQLRGHDLACWCPLVDADGNPVPCHADVLLELANR